MRRILPGSRSGRVVAPPSKSHQHRLLIANFLAGDRDSLKPCAGDSDDVIATKRCLAALGGDDPAPVLDCGESGSTLRFLAPLAAALGKHPEYVRRGRLAMRPFRAYDSLEPGTHELAGNVSSQFVTGLLFALPLLGGDSRIVFTSELESRGYVDLTLDTLKKAGVTVGMARDGFAIAGGQCYRLQGNVAEGDWSGAAFWLGMNAMGSGIEVSGLNEESAQPDRRIVALLDMLVRSRGAVTIDVSQCPDIFPVLSVVAASRDVPVEFTGIERLRLKECDRVAAMEETLVRLGVSVSSDAGRFSVHGGGKLFNGGEFRSFGDHRIAMAVAVAATHAGGDVVIDDADCAAKSYPGFFETFELLDR